MGRDALALTRHTREPCACPWRGIRGAAPLEPSVGANGLDPHVQNATASWSLDYHRVAWWITPHEA